MFKTNSPSYTYRSIIIAIHYYWIKIYKSYLTSVNSLYQNNKLKKQLNKHEYGELVSLFAHSHYCNESNQNN